MCPGPHAGHAFLAGTPRNTALLCASRGRCGVSLCPSLRMLTSIIWSSCCLRFLHLKFTSLFVINYYFSGGFRKLHPNPICHQISAHHHSHLNLPSLFPSIYLFMSVLSHRFHFPQWSIIHYRLYLFWCPNVLLFGNEASFKLALAFLNLLLIEHFLMFWHNKI